MFRFNSLSRGVLVIFLFSPILYYIFGVWTGLYFTPILKMISIIIGTIFIFRFKSKLEFPGFLSLLFLFFIYRLLFSYFNNDESLSLPKLLYQNNELGTLFILLLAVNTQYSHRFILFCILIFKTLIVFSVIISIIQVFQPEFFSAAPYYLSEDWEFSIDQNIYTVRRLSLFGFMGQNALGLSFIPLLSVLTGYMLSRKDNLLWFYLVAGGIVAALTNTRYVMIGFLIVLIQILVASRIKFIDILKYLFISLLSISILYYAIRMLGYNIIEWIDVRLLAEGSIDETTRFKALSTFGLFFPKNPWFGTGVMTDDILNASAAVGSSHIHVGYLSHLVMYGIIGCFFLYGFWFLITKRFYQNAKLTNYWGAFFAMMIFLWSFSTMSESSIFFQGLIFAFVFDKYYTDKNHSKIPAGIGKYYSVK